MAQPVGNTVFFPASALGVPLLRFQVQEQRSKLGREHRELFERLIDALDKQERYNTTLKLALDDALRLVHQRINKRAATGLLADRPAPESEGALYLAGDEVPPRLYVTLNNVWIGFTAS